jgi:molybdopterin/thiamine biosynthesis adenylyltransferase
MLLSKEELERYSRQIAIDKIGIEGQNKLKNFSVVVAGAGGLGNPISLYLAASGVGKIGIVDGDKVSLSNLGRQILYNTRDIGKEKVLLAKERLVSLNPNIKIEIYDTWLTEEGTASQIFKKYDAVIDATDNFETRYLINKTAVKLNKPLFIGAVGRFVGQVMSVLPGKTACFNCVFPEKDREVIQLMTERNLSLGVMGTIVGITGSIVANETIKYVLGMGNNLFDKLLIFDSLNNDFSIINLERNPGCKVCGSTDDKAGR